MTKKKKRETAEERDEEAQSLFGLDFERREKKA
jgi:hypothetical protein